MNKFIVIAILLLASCKRDSEVQQSQIHCTPDNKFVLAGVASKCMLVNKFNPMVLPIESYVVTDNGVTKIDIDKDNIDDIVFSYFTVSEHTEVSVGRANTKFSLPVSGFNDGIAIDQTSPSKDTLIGMGGNAIMVKSKDTISNANTLWVPTSSDGMYQYQSGKYKFGGDSYTITTGYLINPITDKYIPLMYVNGTDSLYGWIHFSVDASYLTIYDCAIQQKY